MFNQIIICVCISWFKPDQTLAWDEVLERWVNGRIFLQDRIFQLAATKMRIYVLLSSHHICIKLKDPFSLKEICGI